MEILPDGIRGGGGGGKRRDLVAEDWEGGEVGPISHLQKEKKCD